MDGTIEDRHGGQIKPQGNDCAMTDMEVRIWLRDTHPEDNLLLDDFEFKPEEIRTAMNMAVDKWNDTPPDIRRYDYDHFPYRSIFILGVSSILLSMAATLYRRNSLAINAGGTAVNDQDKSREYDQAAARLRDEFLQAIRMKKRELNANMGWGYA